MSVVIHEKNSEDVYDESREQTQPYYLNIAKILFR